jgi:transcriptional regulator NrdR family protein
MNCPHCGQPESRVTETRQGADFDRRTRICRSCAKSFQTIERVAVYGGRAIGYIEAGDMPLVEEEHVA